VRAVVQRVSSAAVSVDGAAVGSVGPGLVVLLGVAQADTEADAAWTASKIATLRVFDDGGGKMNLSVVDTRGAVLLVSQFTLLADCSRGRRPSFTRAAPPDVGRELCDRVGELLRRDGLAVETGRFGAHMALSLVNDGPVTIVLDSAEGRR